MALLYEWVKQIILFILIGTILELLIPNNAMKKYVHLVFGLLLLLLLLQPLFSLFRVNVITEIENIEKTLFQNFEENADIESLIENQKKEIESEHAAYIWSELESDLIQRANPVLEEMFQQRVVEIEFEIYEDEGDKEIELKRMLVTTENVANDEDHEMQKITDIHIQPIFKNETSNKQIPFDKRKMIETLQHLWELSDGQIEIMWEGGTS